MICVRLQKPVCRSAQEIVKSTIPSAIACATRAGSARGNECSWLVLKLGGRLGRLDRTRRHERGCEESEGDEWEEPRDVEVEPVREHDLKADQKRGGQCRKLDLMLDTRHEEESDGGDHQGDLQAGLVHV